MHFSPDYAMGWMTGVQLPAGTEVLSLCHHILTGSGAHPISYPVISRALSIGVKQLGIEAVHSPPPSAKVRNAWSYISIPHMPSWHGA